MPTSSKLTLRIHGIARNPLNNPLAGKVLDIMLFSANAYARILKCKEIWIIDPMNEILVNQYQKFGYMPFRDRAGVATHLTMKVRYE